MGGATAGRPVLVVERTSERRCPNMLPITRHLPSTTFTMTTVQKIKVRLIYCSLAMPIHACHRKSKMRWQVSPCFSASVTLTSFTG